MSTSQPIWLPYCGAAPVPAEWLARWNLDPVLILALALGTGLGLIYLNRDRHRLHWFLGGMAVLAVLFVSPLCALTSALFAVRTVHHVLLVTLAAPLFAWALPAQKLRHFANPVLWTIGYAAVFWAWHWPGFYSAALSHDGIYWLMQLTLLASAIGFWAAIRQSAITSAIAGLLATMVQMGLLGALLTFASTPLYKPHLATTAPWGFGPLEDQQLAGLIMWAPAAGFYLLAAILLAGRWLQAENEAAA